MAADGFTAFVQCVRGPGLLWSCMEGVYICLCLCAGMCVGDDLLFMQVRGTFCAIVCVFVHLLVCSDALRISMCI